MSKRTKWALVAVAIIFVIILGAYGLPPQKVCEATRPGQESCSLYGLPLFVTIKVAEFIEDHEPFFTATASIAIAVFTATLWYSTKKLWLAGERQLAHSKDTSQRQLRAYLDFDGVSWLRLAADAPADAMPDGLLVCIKNYGHTPATELVLETRYYLKIGEGEPKPLGEAGVEKLESIAPTDHLSQRGKFEMPDYVWAAIGQGKAIFISEFKVSYVDAFDNSHTLESQTQSEGLMGEHTFIAGTRKSD
jgi:hypothetical protein